MDTHWSVADRTAAKELFGRPARVLLASWVLSRGDDAFYLQQAQDALAPLGESRSAISQEAQLLRRYGMLDSYHDGRRLYFVPTSSRFWDAFRHIATSLQLDLETASDESSPSL